MNSIQECRKVLEDYKSVLYDSFSLYDRGEWADDLAEAVTYLLDRAIEAQHHAAELGAFLSQYITDLRDKMEWHRSQL